MVSRREFVQRGAASLLASSLHVALMPRDRHGPNGFLDLMRAPDVVSARTAAGEQPLVRAAGGTRWTGAGLSVDVVEVPGALRVDLAASPAAGTAAAGVLKLGLRWNGGLDATRQLLGDAWERGYGDFEWRGFVPDRVMPWYVMASDGTRTDGYGVRTGAGAMCFWQVDRGGISLWADVRSGGAPLQLGDRTLAVCHVVCRAGKPGESAFAAVHAFCRQMCAAPRLPPQPVYGSNDWYYAYGEQQRRHGARRRGAHRGAHVHRAPTGRSW